MNAKAWFVKKVQAWRMRRALKMLVWVAKHCPDVLSGFITDRASSIAKATTMKYLEQQGYMHCDFCPTRFGLRHVGRFMVCLAHIKKASDIVKQEAKPAKAA